MRGNHEGRVMARKGEENRGHQRKWENSDHKLKH